MKELEGQAEGEENRRYDLYIVSENLEEEQKEEKTGHLNECFTTTEEEERPSDYTALSRATTAVVRCLKGPGPALWTLFYFSIPASSP